MPKEQEVLEAIGEVAEGVKTMRGDVSALDKRIKNIEDVDTDAQQKLIDNLSKNVEGLAEKVEAMREARKAADIPGLQEEARKEGFQMARVVTGQLTGDWGEGFEREVMDEIAERANIQGTSGKGGLLVPAFWHDQLIEKLQARNALLKLGAQMWDNLSGGTFHVPVESVSPTVTARANDGVALTETDVTITEVQFTGYEAGAIVPVSERLLRNAGQSERFDGWLSRSLVKASNRWIDSKGIAGSGSSEPTGLINVSGVGDGSAASDADGGRAAGDKMSIEAIAAGLAALESSGVMQDPGSLAAIWHANTKNQVRTQRVDHYSAQASGQGFVFAPILGDKALEDALGFKHGSTTYLNAPSGSNNGQMVIGDFEEFVVAMWGVAKIDVSDHFYFNKAQKAVRLLLEMDSNALQPAAFRKYTDIGVS